MLDFCIENNIFNTITAYTRLALSYAPLLGVCCFSYGLFEIYKCQKAQTSGIGKGLAGVVFGSILVALPLWYVPIASSIFSKEEAIRSGAFMLKDTLVVTKTCYGWGDLIKAFVQFVGVVGLIRGFFHLQYTDIRNRKYTKPQCITMIIGSVIAINIAPFLNLFAATLNIPIDFHWWRE